MTSYSGQPRRRCAPSPPTRRISVPVLNPWGQKLMQPPHLHGLLPGGGIAPDENWGPSRAGFFLPVRVLSRLFRGLHPRSTIQEVARAIMIYAR
jgi:hypothetical protein